MGIYMERFWFFCWCCANQQNFGTESYPLPPNKSTPAKSHQFTVNVITFVSIAWMMSGFGNMATTAHNAWHRQQGGLLPSHREVSRPLWLHQPASRRSPVVGTIDKVNACTSSFHHWRPKSLHLAQGKAYTLKLTAQDYGQIYSVTTAVYCTWQCITGQINFKFVIWASQVSTDSALLVTCSRITSWSEPSPSHGQSCM
jgi:hypothetical protein